MSDLVKAVEGAMEKLGEVRKLVQEAYKDRIPVPGSCYEFWGDQAKRESALKATRDILPTRDSAWEIVKRILDDERVVDRIESTVRFYEQTIPFAVARHLALAAYLTVTWSIYDRLTNVCGRMIGSMSVESGSSNPKLVEQFMRSQNREKHGFSLGRVLHPTYGWPAAVSYEIRNWLVHEGPEAKKTPLFLGNTLANGYELSEQAMVHITAACGKYELAASDSRLYEESDDHPWYDRSLITILEKYHSEIDEMFCRLLEWSAGSLLGQATAFSARDK